MCLSNAPNGIRSQEFVSTFPTSIYVATTFDKDLIYAYSRALGEEYYSKGINIALRPVAGPLRRIARGGRNQEGLSIDPYLASASIGAIIRGIQDVGVITTTKV